jgi:hypothetical protein
MNDEVQNSQQDPEKDSGLQTPQPDQPIPTDQERFEQQQREAADDVEDMDSPPVPKPSTEPPGGSSPDDNQ